MMKKVVIPVILAGIVLSSAIFALMPVEKVSTTHTQVNTPLGGNLVVLPAATVAPLNAGADQATWTIGVPFCVVGAYRTGGSDPEVNLNVSPFDIFTDLTPINVVNLAFNDAAGAASIAAADLLGREAAGIIDVPLCGNNSISILANAAGGDITDTNILQVIIQTRGAFVPTAAAIS
jgi:hypothetical protein